MVELLVVTNNQKVQEKYQEQLHVVTSKMGYLYPLYDARDKVHSGYRLLSHPLCGSLKPNQTPYKSILLEASNEGIDLNSVRLIENAIESTLKFLDCRQTPLWTEKCLNDFRTIDLSLIQKSIGVSLQYIKG